ncbi:MAG: sulfotransferase domain-containing protein, partial [Halocynthiibacter sp.]
LMLRDPRDVMVSAYYSIAFSHSHPANQTEHRAFQTRRNRARQLGLTGYLSVAAREYIPKYATFAAQLLPHSNVTFLTYEDMHGDFHTWSRRFLSGLGVAEDPDLLADIANLYQKGQPKADNPRAHRRQGRPGDFERKLDAQGQDFLNQTTQQIRDQFGTWQN